MTEKRLTVLQKERTMDKKRKEVIIETLIEGSNKKLYFIINKNKNKFLIGKTYDISFFPAPLLL